MNTTDIMKDPFFTPILFQIENRIRACSRAAKADGIELNDSQIRSTLNKVRKTSEGGKPQIPNSSPREQVFAGLHGDLVKMRTAFMSEDSEGNREPLPTKAWTLCIRTIEDSIQRHSTGPGSRGYQDFLENFLPKSA
jgi:hypothetical protein